MFLRKYGVETTVIFPAIKAGDTAFAASGDWTPVSGDSKVSKDGGNVANTSNTVAAVGGTGSVLWTLTLTATEMQAALVVVQIVDAALEDQAIVIETYGHASAQHAFDLDTAINVSNGLVEVDIRAIDTDQTADTKLHDAVLALNPIVGTFQAGSTTAAVVLASGASAIDDFYNGSMIYFFSAPAAGQVRKIIDYDGSSRTATLDRVLVTAAPDAGDFYITLHNYDNAPEDLADTLLRRPTSATETGWTADARTLYAAVAGLTHKRVISGSNIVLYKSNDSTVLVTIPIVTDSGQEPIVSADPP